MRNYNRTLFQYILPVFFLLVSGVTKAQNFIELANPSGFELSAFEQRLEDSTDVLLGVFPSPTYVDSFSIFDIGFYLHNEKYQGEYLETFNYAISQAEALSPYYVLIGRAYRSDGKLDIYVESKFPNGGDFDCLDIEERGLLNDFFATSISIEIGSNLDDYNVATAMGNGIHFLANHLHNMLYCDCVEGPEMMPSCNLNPDIQTINIQLLGLGWRKTEIQIVGETGWDDSNGIYDYADKKFYWENEIVDIPNQVLESKITFDSLLSGRVYILDNESFANGEWVLFSDDVSDPSIDYVEGWAILNDGGQYYLYSKYYLGGEGFASLNQSFSAESRSAVALLPMKWILKALGNAALDGCLQAIIYRILDEDVNDWESAANKVSVLGALWEGVSSLLPWEKTKNAEIYLRAATSAFVVVLDNAIASESYTVQQGFIDFTVGFGASVLTQLASHPKVSEVIGSTVNTVKRTFAEGLSRWHKNTTYAIVQTVVRNAIKATLGDGGEIVKIYDQYVSKELYEVFYRKMSIEDYNSLKSTFKVPGTGETSTSPNIEFLENYSGVLVKLYARKGTINKLKAYGKNAEPGNTPQLVLQHFGNFTHGSSGWNSLYVRFKLEPNALVGAPGANLKQVNIQLGYGDGLDKFNNNLLFFEQL